MKLFLSYTRSKDIFLKVSTFRDRIEAEVAIRSPGSVVFQDKTHLHEGDHFPDALANELRKSDVLLILVSPAWLVSEWCRHEYLLFTQDGLNADRLQRILPILWVDTPQLVLTSPDPIARALASINYADWRDLRYGSWDDPASQKQVGKLAERALALGTRLSVTSPVANDPYSPSAFDTPPTESVKSPADSPLRGYATSARLDSNSTVLFDEPIKTWLRTPPNIIGYSSALKLLPKLSTVISNNNGYSTQASLENARILILPTPRDLTISEQEINVISDWVYRGGSLLVMGFYLVEAHHGNNINSLVQRFGIEFKDDIIMPVERFRSQSLGLKIEPGMELFRYCMGQGFDVSGTDSCVLSQPVGVPDSHPLLESVSKVALTSCCSVECALNAEVTVCTSDPVAILHAVGIKDSSRRLARIERYVLDQCAPVQFMVAVKHGAGKVVAIGTWKIFLNELVDSVDNSNGILFGNIVEWLWTK
jgi:hypothetical protein